jgi:hypothetical protein
VGDGGCAVVVLLKLRAFCGAEKDSKILHVSLKAGWSAAMR